MDEKEQAADPVRPCVSSDIEIVGIGYNDSTDGVILHCGNPRHVITAEYPQSPDAYLLEQENNLTWDDAVLAVAKHLKQFSK